VGFVLVTAKIGRNAIEAKDVEFLVDTGAFQTVLSPELIEQLRIDTPVEMIATTAENREVPVRMGSAFLELGGRQSGISVVEMDVPIPLLGVSALEALGFKVDPVLEQLEPTRPFGPAVLRI
jgi:clan AA aspartic protease